MLFRVNQLTRLANIFSLQLTEISECQPSSSYQASKSQFLPYFHCKFCRVCPTTKMTSATVKPPIELEMFLIWTPYIGRGYVFLGMILTSSHTVPYKRAWKICYEWPCLITSMLRNSFSTSVVTNFKLQTS